MAHKKGVGSTDNGRDSNPKRLGVKLYGGQHALAGNIIVRQRGTKFHPGENVYKGKDFTLHAAIEGTVSFRKRQKNRIYVSILPAEDATAAPKPAAKAKKPKVEEPKAKAVETVEAEAPAPKVEEPKPAPKAEAPKEAPKAEEPKPEAPKEEPKAAAPKKKAAGEKITLPSGKKIKQDDLKIVDGIGPKIEGLLNDDGITTWEELASAPTEKVQAILDEAGSRYRMHDPATWAKQARLAADGDWAGLEEFQESLKS